MKINPIEKPKKIKGTKYYDAKLWEFFSKFIRLRDSNICFTCGKKILSKKGYHAGHFIPVGANGGHALKFDERNVHGQCYHCNINLGGNGAIYAEKMRAKYGQAVIDELWKMHDHPTKWQTSEFVAKLEKYKIKVKYFH